MEVINHQLCKLNDPKHIVAFTDGSALGNPGPTGSGAVVYHTGLSSEPTPLASAVSKQSNNVHGEIFAIKLACSNIKTTINQHHRSVNFFCDCQTAILVIANLERAENYSELIREIQMTFFDLQLNYNVDINMYWVPGHAGIAQNETADNLAKIGAQQAISTDLTHPVTLSEAFKSIKEITSLKWTKRWSLQRTSTEYRSKVSAPGMSIIRNLTSIAPNLQKQIIRLRLDHTDLPAHKARYITNIDPLCTTCECQCDVNHILTECPIYAKQRDILLDNIQFITSSDFKSLSIQNICPKTITCFDQRLNIKERNAILTTLATFIRNSKVSI